MEVLELAGIGEIKVRRSANIKYLRIRMAPGRGVWVSVPFGVSPETRWRNFWKRIGSGFSKTGKI